MKTLILGSVIGIALSGCSETINYDWLAGDWSCNIDEFDYNYDLQKYNEQGRVKFIDYDRHIEIIEGKAYAIVYETFKKPIHETKF